MSDMDWQARGACAAHITPELWFSNDRRDIAEAKRICKRECWVQSECGAFALENDVHGVWAGLTAEERGVIKKRSAA